MQIYRLVKKMCFHQVISLVIVLQVLTTAAKNNDFFEISHFRDYKDNQMHLNISKIDSDMPFLNVTIKPTKCTNENYISQLRFYNISTNNSDFIIIPPLFSTKFERIYYDCWYNIDIKNFNEKISYFLNDSLVDDVKIDVFNTKTHYTSFKITWGESFVNSLVDLQIFLLENDSYKIDRMLSEERLNLTQNKALIKPSTMIDHPFSSVKLGHKYKIKIKEDEWPFREQIHYLRVPDCVKDKCDCNKYAYKLINIDRLSNYEYKIVWKSIGEKMQLVDIDFHYSNGSQIFRTNVVDEKSLNSNFAILKLDYLKNDEKYEISAGFNSIYCHLIANNTLHFNVKINKFSSHITEIVLSMVISVLLITFLLFYTKNIIITKLKTILPGYKTNRNILQPLNNMPINVKETQNVIYVPEEIIKIHDKYEFPRNKIEVKKEIDGGAFGCIYYAKAYNINGTSGYTMVAIKQLRKEARQEEVKDFQAEIDILKTIGDHPHIVKLLGCCTLEQPLMMIMELIPSGGLKKYLLNLRQQWESQKNRQRFFPDDMDINWWTNKTNQSKQLNYPPLTFTDTSDGSYIISPDTPSIPKTPNSPLNMWRMVAPKTPDGQWNQIPSPRPFLLKNPPNRLSKGSISESQSPNSPTSIDSTPLIASIASSRLASTTETLSTTLEFDAHTPNIEEFVKPFEISLSSVELQDFASQIADGMAYLETFPIVHRDLAARNILITADKTLKISDFGMSKHGDYVVRSDKPLPLRWMAIEAIENKQCNSKSDVWSFGVVLWEIGTLGAHPYKELQNEAIYTSLKSGVRLNRPEICTDELYSLMQRCWCENPDERPTFSEICNILDVNKRKMYVDFTKINLDYVFPPTNLNNK